MWSLPLFLQKDLNEFKPELRSRPIFGGSGSGSGSDPSKIKRLRLRPFKIKRLRLRLLVNYKAENYEFITTKKKIIFVNLTDEK